MIKATDHDQTLHGTSCNDTFVLGQWGGITVHAGAGDDTVRAGFKYYSNRWLYLGDGNDTVVNANNVKVWVDGGTGNDTIDGNTGSDGADVMIGGAGFDSATVTVGDHYPSIENLL